MNERERAEFELQRGQWYEGEEVAGVEFALGQAVMFAAGPHAVRAGSVISLETVLPEPTYLVEFGDDGSDAMVAQSALSACDDDGFEV
jgi:hypothetical protein